mgnify:FL=1
MNEKMELNQNQLKSILAAIGMEKARDINIKEIPQQDSCQIILIVEFTGGNPETKLLAYVNFKQGYPTTDQVFDSIYGAGKGSDLRIILYNNRDGYDEKNPTAADHVISPAVDEFND